MGVKVGGAPNWRHSKGGADEATTCVHGGRRDCSIAAKGATQRWRGGDTAAKSPVALARQVGDTYIGAHTNHDASPSMTPTPPRSPWSAALRADSEPSESQTGHECPSSASLRTLPPPRQGRYALPKPYRRHQSTQRLAGTEPLPPSPEADQLHIPFRVEGPGNEPHIVAKTSVRPKTGGGGRVVGVGQLPHAKCWSTAPPMMMRTAEVASNFIYLQEWGGG